MNSTAISAPPNDAIAAVTHPDPYGFYAGLVAEQPFYRDGRLGCWVATGARAVAAVLADPACRVRPVGEVVPKALADSPAGTIFGRLVRMNDGPVHAGLKKVVCATLDGIETEQSARMGERWSRTLASRITPGDDPGQLAECVSGISCYVIGSLLGVADVELSALNANVAEFARALAPVCTSEQLERGRQAAGRLLAQFLELSSTDDSRGCSSLIGDLATRARRSGGSDGEALAANAIGFLTQAYDALAGLVATSVLTLARSPALAAEIGGKPHLLSDFIDEVLRYDSPVQNTRRFVAEPTVIETQTLRPGETVLVVLAAANRDPSVNADPYRFDISRRQRRIFSFGDSAHACPGRRLAATIGSAAVSCLLQRGIVDRLQTFVAYRPSANSRIPILAWR